MSFTSASEVLLKLNKVNLVFQADVHRAWTWREAFSRLSSDPISMLVSAKDRLHVARDISLEIRDGERVALMGVNGSGKTSLCRCIAGMYRPQSGTVERHGEVRAIFDTAAGIQPELTGRENARLLAQFLFPVDPNRDRTIEEALSFSELGKFLDVPFRLYSNGMKARLCLSLVSSKAVDLLILDEVFDGADAFFREKVSARMLAMIEASGAVVFVSHSPDQIQRICNRLIVLHLGQIGYDGPVAEGLRYYASIRPKESEIR